MAGDSLLAPFLLACPLRFSGDRKGMANLFLENRFRQQRVDAFYAINRLGHDQVH
jgi:hypothetical protein